MNRRPVRAPISMSLVLVSPPCGSSHTHLWFSWVVLGHLMALTVYRKHLLLLGITIFFVFTWADHGDTLLTRSERPSTDQIASGELYIGVALVWCEFTKGPQGFKL